MSLQSYKICVSEKIIEDLYYRLNNIRWPKELSNNNWTKGSDLDYVKSLIDYWKVQYDWKKQESILNRLPHYHCKIDGLDIHFIYKKGKTEKTIPLILTHGWPDSFIRYQKIIPLLTDPVSCGIDTDESFDLVIPSLPGFGFSAFSFDKEINNFSVSEMWHTLMIEKLGYSKYAAGGGDIGSGVTRYLAANHPDELIAIHLTDIGIIRGLLLNEKNLELDNEETEYVSNLKGWIAQEGAYISIHSTKPQTISYSLSDSLVGLTAWIIEKFQSWSGCKGNLDNFFTKDELLTNIMIYWISNSIGSSVNIYYENSHSLPELDYISVPTGVALFPNDILLPPEKWARQNLNIVDWSVIENGGHFTAMEEPELYADNIRNFFRNFR